MFASGRNSIAFCDRCGRKVPYLDLKQQVVNQYNTDLWVCDDCLDIDHEQNSLNLAAVAAMSDPQALRHSRTDVDIPVIRGSFGWNPVVGIALTVKFGVAKAA